MPMRFFLYAAKLYEKYIASSEYYAYSSTLQRVPCPKCICFYNGTKEQPEREVLKLSDAFGGKGDIEVNVTMLNINYGKNQMLMNACEPLKEYAWLVDSIRQKQKTLKDLEVAVDAAIEEMPREFVIRGFLLQNKAELYQWLHLMLDYPWIDNIDPERYPYRRGVILLDDSGCVSGFSGAIYSRQRIGGHELTVVNPALSL